MCTVLAEVVALCLFWGSSNDNLTCAKPADAPANFSCNDDPNAELPNSTNLFVVFWGTLIDSFITLVVFQISVGMFMWSQKKGMPLPTGKQEAFAIYEMNKAAGGPGNSMWYPVCRQTSKPHPRYGGWHQWKKPLLLNNSYHQEFISDALRKPARFVDAEGMITCKIVWAVQPLSLSALATGSKGYMGRLPCRTTYRTLIWRQKALPMDRGELAPGETFDKVELSTEVPDDFPSEGFAGLRRGEQGVSTLRAVNTKGETLFFLGQRQPDNSAGGISSYLDSMQMHAIVATLFLLVPGALGLGLTTQEAVDEIIEEAKPGGGYGGGEARGGEAAGVWRR